MLLEPLADAVGCHVLAGRGLFADDTPVRLLAPGAGRPAFSSALTEAARSELRWRTPLPLTDNHRDRVA